MKKLINILAQTTLLWMIGCDSKPTTDDLGLVPLPSSISIAKSQTLINSQWAVTQNDGHKDLNSLKEMLSENLYSDYGLLVSDFSSKTINLNVIEDNNSYGEEGYHLSVSDQTVQINAGTPNGIFYGIQTFRQLLDSGKNLIRVFKLIKLRSKITRDLNGEVCTWMLDATFSILDS